MKLTPLKLVAISTVALAATIVPNLKAQSIFTDDFTVSTPVVGDPNFEIENRQTGGYAPSFYGNLFNGNNIQLGNTANVGQPGGVDGNYLYMAGTSGLQNLLVIDEVLADGKPLTISFDLYTQGNLSAGGDWMGFSLSAGTSSTPVVGAGQFGMLVRQNGGMAVRQDGELFSHNSGFVTSTSWTLVFSDPSGVGSAFAGSGSLVSIYNGGNLVDSVTLPTSLLTTGLSLGFFSEGTMIGGVDNLSVATIPEPSTILLSFLGAGAVVLLRRKAARRATVM
jgi:hypothetical protein